MKQSTNLGMTQGQKIITLEEHFWTPEISDNPHNDFVATMMGHRIIDNLLDVADDRLNAMDDAGIDMQVLSEVAPGVQSLRGQEALDLARTSNDRLAAAVRAHPARLAGFATLPMSEPERAADELGRCMEDLGLVGALINTTFGPNGRFLDDPVFEPVLNRAEQLSAPIYLHPSPADPTLHAMLYDGFNPGVSEMLATASWGWHIETGLHALRLVLAGVLERHPGLRFVVGHCGEVLPFMMARIDEFFSMTMTGLPLMPSEYFLRNFWVTTSAFTTLPPVQCALQVCGVDRVLFSVDYPFGNMTACRALLDNLPLSPVDLAKVAGGNAERLLDLDRSGHAR